MSSSPPPTYVVNIYNPAYFTSSTTGLTQAQANNLYLQKGTPDTATALETFTSGIATNTLQTTSITGDLSIYPAQTSGNIYLGANSTSSTGRTGTIHIGDGNSMPVGATIHINNGTSNASNTNIMNGTSTSGTCNILTGSTTSGTCNIATGTGATQTTAVNIGSGSTTGTLTLGNSANTVAINGAVTLAKPLTLGSAPSVNTQLGYRVDLMQNQSYTTSATGGTITSPYNFTLPVGVWLITTSTQPTTTSNWITTSVSLTNSALEFTRWAVCTNSTGAGTTNQITAVLNNTSASTTHYFVVQAQASSVTLSNTYGFATRIA